ncbi:MAG: hypothetical protein EZS28_008863 [Streblomastix strix]|uniref:Uncharacterized protein n=1 Tax=Streblomastix strix TaxID=222440 RepID=A0A5J4WM23_9EUKA|nr:MAG: hypothetical protein EZS28_008863 [Streblomastix strix]
MLSKYYSYDHLQYTLDKYFQLAVQLDASSDQCEWITAPGAVRALSEFVLGLRRYKIKKDDINQQQEIPQDKLRQKQIVERQYFVRMFQGFFNVENEEELFDREDYELNEEQQEEDDEDDEEVDEEQQAKEEDDEMYFGYETQLQEEQQVQQTQNNVDQEEKLIVGQVEQEQTLKDDQTQKTTIPFSIQHALQYQLISQLHRRYSLQQFKANLSYSMNYNAALAYFRVIKLCGYEHAESHAINEMLGRTVEQEIEAKINEEEIEIVAQRRNLKEKENEQNDQKQKYKENEEKQKEELNGNSDQKEVNDTGIQIRIKSSEIDRAMLVILT